MKLSHPCLKKDALTAVAGALLALAVLSGCKKAARPPVPPPAKPVAGAAAAGTNKASGTNLDTEFASVFDDSPRPANKARDPFNPDSTRLDPAPPTNTTPVIASGPVDPQLKLHSVTGSPGRWLAVINNQILSVNEEVIMKVPGGTVRLKVLEIGPEYAVILVDGTQKRLTMGQKK